MTDVAVTERSPGKLAPERDDSCFRCRRARSVPPIELPRQLTAGELLERVAELPSREGMRPPRADLADNLQRFYQALWRHAHGRHTARFRLTWGQMLAACGYEDKPYRRPETPIRRYAALLEEAGLARISGRDELADGRTCVVTLLEPPESELSPRSSVDEATKCRAVRRRETRSQRVNRRVRPWCPKGGRGRAAQRWDFLWGSYVSAQGLDPPKGGSKPTTQDVRAREAGGIDAIHRRGCGAGNAGPVPDRGAALEAARTAATREGLEALHELARAPVADPVALAIAGWELLFDQRRPGLSRRRRLHLERAVAVLDRIERPGYGVGALLAMMHAVACDLEDQAEGVPVGVAPALGRHREQPAPATLSYFVARLRSLARARRRSWRATRERSAGGSDRGGSGA